MTTQNLPVLPAVPAEASEMRGSGFAVRIGSVSQFGRSRQNVRCSCGQSNSFYLWSWAGHGKAKCQSCGKFICYRTLQVFTDPEDLQWRHRIREADAQNVPDEPQARSLPKNSTP